MISIGNLRSMLGMIGCLALLPATLSAEPLSPASLDSADVICEIRVVRSEGLQVEKGVRTLHYLKPLLLLKGEPTLVEINLPDPRPTESQFHSTEAIVVAEEGGSVKFGDSWIVFLNRASGDRSTYVISELLPTERRNELLALIASQNYRDEKIR